MKSYSDYMNEIIPDDLYKGLLKEGLFSEKLPPIFTSEPFYEYCRTCAKGTRQKWKKKAEWIPYTFIRNNGMPRQLGIPSPFAYERLCNCLFENWPKIQNVFQENTKRDCDNKVSQIHIRKMSGTDALFEMNYKNWRMDSSPEEKLRIGARYAVETDISTCFPSIYTHAIPWSVYGKKGTRHLMEVMSNSQWKAEWTNQLDTYCRNTTNSETHGILIGPHTSNIISELILTKIDAELRKENWDFVRYIDDYHCYVSTYGKGKIFLSHLDRILRDYDLQLNYKKTKITALPQYEKSYWTEQINLNAEVLLNQPYLKYNIVRNYWSHLIQSFNENPNEAAIFNYGLKALVNRINRQDIRVSANARNYIINTMEYLSCIYVYLIPLMEKYVFDTFSVDKKDIQEYANKIYATEAGIGSAEAKTYAFYYALKYDFALNSNITFDKIIQSNDCILKLMAYLYFRREKLDNYINQLLEQVEAMDETDQEKNWLYVYEILEAENIKMDFFPQVKKAKVSFLKEKFRMK